MGQILMLALRLLMQKEVNLRCYVDVAKLIELRILEITDE
jgi:hypothetical protein